MDQASTLSLALPVVIVLLAGCASTVPPTDVDTQPPAVPPVQVLGACHAFRTFFPSPTQGFEPLVPDGFQMATENNGATVTVTVLGFDCGNESQMWALLPVTPPVGEESPGLEVDGVVLQAFTTNATAAEAFHALGFTHERLVRARTQSHDHYNGVLVQIDALELGEGSLDYRIETTVQPDGSAFGATQYRLWATNGTAAVGSLYLTEGPGTSVGAGSAQFRQQGDPAAPPATSGIGHRVDGSALQFDWSPRPTAAPAP